MYTEKILYQKCELTFLQNKFIRYRTLPLWRIMWYDEFIATSNLDPENILIILNEMGEKRTNDTAISEFRLPPQLSSTVCAACNLLHEGDQLRLVFNQFLVTIIAKSEVEDDM
ncbi:hypothetical protein GCK32_006845 [Trichostrongylus colubriformis]|uniref:Uncharacterized protein n=1 Tax=Trichostrongylus colubriformis TaxID=6319 RepID=A0AAN8FS84_TRICO